MAGPLEQNGAPGSGFILNPHELGQKILDWKRKGYHVLAPAIQISSFQPGYGVNASLVLLDSRVDADGSGTDVYFDKNNMQGQGNNNDPTEERAPSKIGLFKISAAAGISWVEPYGRVDPLTIQNLWIYRVTGVYLAYDGTPQPIKGECEIDYRDGSSQIGDWSREAWRALELRNQAAQGPAREYSINGWSERRVRQARAHGAGRAETGALTRAIRTLGIAHSYTIAELKMPFVTLRVCPMIDMSDPDVRRQVTMGMLGGVASLYAGMSRYDSPSAAPRELPPATFAPIQVSAHREPEPVVLPPQVAQPQVAPPQRSQSTPVPQGPAPVPASTLMQSELPGEIREPREEMTYAMPDGAVLLRDVVKTQHRYSAQHTKAGQSFTKWTVTDSNGVLSVTVFPKWGNLIDSCFADGRPVVLQSTPKTYRGTTENEIMNVKDVGPREPGDDRDYEPDTGDGMQL